MSSQLITHNSCKYCHIRASFVTYVISRWIRFVIYPEKRNFLRAKKGRIKIESQFCITLRSSCGKGWVGWWYATIFFIPVPEIADIRVVLVLALWKLVTPTDATYITNKHEIPNLFTYNTWLPQYWQEQHTLLYSWRLRKWLYIDCTSTILML